MRALAAPLGFVAGRALQALLVMLAILVIAFAVRTALGDPQPARVVAYAVLRVDHRGRAGRRLPVLDDVVAPVGPGVPPPEEAVALVAPREGECLLGMLVVEREQVVAPSVSTAALRSLVILSGAGRS
jgi:hypothetical protein